MKTVQLKTAQQFCESVYHKYALALEEKQAKQHRYFLIAQRSAAAAAAVTLVVGASVLAFRQKGGKLSPRPQRFPLRVEGARRAGSHLSPDGGIVG